MDKKNLFAVLMAFWVLFPALSVYPQDRDKLRSEVVSAIKEASDYACSVLLDKKGESRCDYNMIQGKWYPYEPAWHTGQLINALLKAYGITKDKRYLRTAERAGGWWCSLRIKDNPKLDGMIRAIHGDGINYINFSTISDGTPGLFALTKATGNKEYAETATVAGKWMLEHMYVPGKGVFYDVVDPQTGKVLKENSPFWRNKQKQTLYDVARPNNEGSLYRDMYEFTKNGKYKEVFINICNSLIDKQDANGLWMDFTPNNKEKGTFHPRFNLWYAESLINGYDLAGNKKYLDAAVKTLKTYQKTQQKDGTIYYINYLDGKYDNNSLAGSATAFAGLLWIRLVERGVGDEFKENIEKSAQWILKNRFAVTHPDKNLAGAIIDTWSKRKDGTIWLVQRDLGTSFGIRFLVDYYNYKFGKK